MNKPPYKIITPRLLLRCWAPRDAQLMKAALDASLNHLRPWIVWAKHEPQSLDEKVEQLRSFRAKFDSDQDYIYGIFDLAEQRVLGGTGLHTRQGPLAFEIGYWIAVDAVGQGYATEAAAALTRVGLEYCQRDRIEIHCDINNFASAVIPRKLGFRHESTRRRTLEGVLPGERRDAMIWTLLQNELAASACAQVQVSALDAIGRQVM